MFTESQMRSANSQKREEDKNKKFLDEVVEKCKDGERLKDAIKSSSDCDNKETLMKKI